ncbi:MAG TPA: hypothetical protein VFG54_04740 [Prolixibacteraceae bacterium]|nr:hypothetical protein [Prolixibacteraceae bacterium]
MKKLLFIIILLSCISTLTYSQSKTEFGITTEGSWFMPKRTDGRDWATKAGFGTGIGVYASQNVFWRFSADIGFAYRYKQMKQHYKVYNFGGGYGSGYPYESDNIEGWDKLSLHYIVVPVHLQLLLSKSFFVRGGIESGWLLNYEAVNEKPEYNWTAGFGSQKHKLKWSVNYIKGFKDQGFGDRTLEADGHYRGSINRNNMFQLNLSYPIWQNQ